MVADICLHLKVQWKFKENLVQILSWLLMIAPGDSDHSTIKKSVERTTNWMVRCSDWLEKNPEYYDHEQVVFP